MDPLSLIVLVLTAAGCTASAVWLIRSALAGIEKALAVHIEEDKAIHAKVIKLEKQRSRR